jgi:RimJ/RimL family protein N-acetyltransferase
VFSYENICITPIQTKDAEFLTQVRSDEQTYMNLGTFCLVSPESQKRWIQSLDEQKVKYFTILRDTDLQVGVLKITGIDLINRSLLIGVDILPSFRGKGLAQKAWKLALRYCFDFLNMHRAWLTVLEENTIGLHIYRKLGFQEEGQLREAVFRGGCYHNLIVMSMLKNEYQKVKNV